MLYQQAIILTPRGRTAKGNPTYLVTSDGIMIFKLPVAVRLGILLLCLLYREQVLKILKSMRFKMEYLILACFCIKFAKNSASICTSSRLAL